MPNEGKFVRRNGATASLLVTSLFQRARANPIPVIYDFRELKAQGILVYTSERRKAAWKSIEIAFRAGLRNPGRKRKEISSLPSDFRGFIHN